MDMLRADRLNRITKAEDEARALRNELKGWDRPATQDDVSKLADAVAQALQAIREII